MKRFKIIASAFCVFLLLFVNSFAFAAESKNKKAIIVVPCLCGSNLFFNGENNDRYSNGEAVWLGATKNIKDAGRSLKAVYKLKKYWQDLLCDENGNSINKNIGIRSKENNFKYDCDKKLAEFGLLYNSEKLIKSLKQNFKNHEVFLNSYDWRLDIEQNGKLLANTIKQYDEVIVIGHSMGGLVTSSAAVDLYNEGQLSKIKSFISVAVPFNGSVEMPYSFEEGLKNQGFLIKTGLGILGLNAKIREVSRSCLSNYQLLPTKNYIKNSGKYLVKNKKELDYRESIEVLKSRNYSQKRQKFFEQAEKFHDRLFINGKHITSYLNTHIIAGIGTKTPSKITINTSKDNNSKIIEYTDGDISVPFKESAVPVGMNPKDAKTFKGVKHNFFLENKHAIQHIVSLISKM